MQLQGCLKFGLEGLCKGKLAAYIFSLSPCALQQQSFHRTSILTLDVPYATARICALYYGSNMPVKFGSVGDIVVVGQLLIKLLNALDDCHGSVADYQNCKHEIYELQKLLGGVEHLIREFQNESTLQATFGSALDCIAACHNTLLNFQKMIEPYQSSFERSTPLGYFSKTIRKIKWSMKEKDEASKFRTKITDSKKSLDCILIMANM